MIRTPGGEEIGRPWRRRVPPIDTDVLVELPDPRLLRLCRWRRVPPGEIEVLLLPEVEDPLLRLVCGSLRLLLVPPTDVDQLDDDDDLERTFASAIANLSRFLRVPPTEVDQLDDEDDLERTFDSAIANLSRFLRVPPTDVDQLDDDDDLE